MKLSSYAGSLEKRFPGIFEAGAQIDFIQEGLKCSDEDYPDTYKMRSFPVVCDPPSEDIGETAIALLDALQDLGEAFPVHTPENESAMRSAAEYICTDLHTWLADVLEEIKDPYIIHGSKLPRHISILVLRIFVFLSSWDTDFDSSLVEKACLTFGIISIHRYSKSILLQIANDFQTSVANRKKSHREFVNQVKMVISTWVNYSAMKIPELFEEASGRFHRISKG